MEWSTEQVSWLVKRTPTRSNQPPLRPSRPGSLELLHVVERHAESPSSHSAMHERLDQMRRDEQHRHHEPHR